MPRGPRLDAPGILHHVMVRGIEGRLIFCDDADRTAFLERLADLAPAGGLTVYAWALLPNHSHFLLRTGPTPLARVMRRLLTGYAGAFNRRHRRHGHVFQNRYKSIVVEEETYFLELVRYVHLNLLRAGVVPDVAALERCPWSDHSALLGRYPRPDGAEGRELRDVASGHSLCYAPATMPRQPRLDAPGILHHVMVRGLDRQAIFRDDTDRADFVARVAALAEGGGWAVLAWALLANHAHLLVRTGARPLARSLRSLLTGYAGAFNRRHHRTGHLFQNRYKSIVVEEEAYLVELVRYLHLNPLRAGPVPSLAALARYPWSGHSALLGRVSRPWQATAEILGQFGRRAGTARVAYQAFVAAGAAQGRRPELQGGGLVRSAGGWAAVAALRRGREAYQSDERILGSPEFVEQVLRTVEDAPPPRATRVALAALVTQVCQQIGLPVAHLTAGGRPPRVSAVRAGLAYLWVEVLGRPGRPLAAALGVQSAAIPKAARRGARDARRWRAVLEKLG